jgi:hypothetical protein
MELIVLCENGSAHAIIDGKQCDPKENTSYLEPPLLEIATGTTVFFLAIFQNRSNGP